jgi:hypothetical protein
MSSVPNSAADKSLILGELEIEKQPWGKWVFDRIRIELASSPEFRPWERNALIGATVRVEEKTP